MTKYRKTREQLLSSYSDVNNKHLYEVKTREKVWWVCETDTEHVWEAILGNRLSGTSCPICYGRIVTSANSLSRHTNLIREFHKTKNGQLDPNKIAQFSGKKVWWKCDKKHEWTAVVASRTSGQSCPFCAGKMPSKHNNLQYVFPDIASQWSKENELSPEDYLPFSSKKVWWECDKKHKWLARISDRSLSGSGCHVCSGYTKQVKCEVSEDGNSKRCNSCSQMMPKTKFRIRRSKGSWINSICKTCEQLKVVQYRTMTPGGVVAEIIRRKRYECKKRNLPFDLTKQFLLDRLNDNGWECELTGLPMRAIKTTMDEKYQGFHLDSISLDRINHKGGYTKDNIRFVLNQVNIFRSSGSDDRMYKIAKALLDNK